METFAVALAAFQAHIFPEKVVYVVPSEWTNAGIPRVVFSTK